MQSCLGSVRRGVLGSQGVVSLLTLAGVLVGCGPERKEAPRGDQVPRTSNPDPVSPDTFLGDSKGANGATTDLLPVLADTLSLRPFDLEPGEGEANSPESAGLPAGVPTRRCDDSLQPDLGITVVHQEWPSLAPQVSGSSELGASEGFANTRIETWSRSGGIFCSPEQWVRVGWNTAESLAGLQAQVQIQLNTSQRAGARETQRFLIGGRRYEYTPQGHSVSGADVQFERTLTIGSRELPNAVRVVLRENGEEIRRTSGQIFTDPDHPLREVLVRRPLGGPAGSGGSLVTVSKTIRSGVIHAVQAEGVSMKTTIEDLVYLGRKSDGSFSCMPRSGRITDEIVFDLPVLKGTVTVSRVATPQGVVLSSQCSAGLSVENCAVLIQKSLRQALTPYCLY